MASYLILAVSWVVVPAFQYGYHLSALNQVQAPLSCTSGPIASSSLNLPSCIPMDDAAFGLLTSIWTVGGLVGSLVAGMCMNSYGRKGASIQATGAVAAGSLLMSAAPYYSVLLIGRFISGIGAGLGICVVPVYLAEISPPQIRGTIVVMNQLAVVIGILVTQGVGIPLAAPTSWRLVLVISAVISIAQLLTAGIVCESPVWLSDRGRKEEAESATRRLWGTGYHVPHHDERSVDDTLLSPEEEALPSLPTQTVGTWELLRSKELRRPLIIALWIFTAQQGSGINAVMYYSNAILGKVLPDMAAYVSLLITAFNVLMTFPPIFLIERVGRRSILLLSIGGCAITAITAAIGLNVGNPILGSISIVAFVGFFAIGLGPVPYVIISEIVPSNAVGSLSSVGLSFNWLTNFVLGLTFLPLRKLLSGGTREGNIFYVFAVILAVSGGAIARMYR